MDSSGALVNGLYYDAYGQYRVAPTGSNVDVYNYNGRWGYYNDLNTGLTLCQHRFYDVARGRWVNRDPIGYSGGVNLYGYCGSGPVSRFDPSGNDYLKIIGNLSGLDQYGGQVVPMLWPMGSGDQDISKRNRVGIVSALIEANDGTDVLIYSHSRGKPGGSISIHLSTSERLLDDIFPRDIVTAAKVRRALGKGSLGVVWAGFCYSGSAEWKNAWCLLAAGVWAYEGVTGIPGQQLNAPKLFQPMERTDYQNWGDFPVSGNDHG